MVTLMLSYWWLFAIALLIGIATGWWVWAKRQRTPTITFIGKDSAPEPIITMGAGEAAKPVYVAAEPTGLKTAAIDNADSGTASSTANVVPFAAAAAAAATGDGNADASEVDAEAAPPRPKIAPAVGEPDDLMQIKGIGPKLNALLQSLGVTRFDQIAAWSDDDVAEVDQFLESFRGRVTRDAWIAQAAYLAKGDIAGFEAKFGKL